MNRKQLIVFIFSPFKRIDYFVHYFNLIEQLWLFNYGKLANTIKLLNTIVTLTALHSFYLSFQPPISALGCATQFDALLWLVTKSSINFIGGIITLMVLYFNWRLYSKPNFGLLNVLHRAIIRGKWRSFFIESKFKDQNVCVRTRECYLIVLNLFTSIIGTMELVVAAAVVCFVWTIITALPDSLENGTPLPLALFWTSLRLLSSIAFGIGFLTLCINFAHSIGNNFSCTVALLMMFFMKVEQVCKNHLAPILAPQLKTFPLMKFIEFRRTFVRTLEFFFEINSFHGRLFCVYLVTYTPINIIYSMWIIQGKLGHISQMVIIFFVAYSTNLLFVFHYMFAQCTKHIHKPGKALARVLARDTSTRKMTTRTRIHVAHFVAAFHTQKRYGFTYANFGLVTLDTFSKFLILYAKFCLISYKLMKKRVIE